jgi:hypothetical protein
VVCGELSKEHAGRGYAAKLNNLLGQSLLFLYIAELSFGHSQRKKLIESAQRSKTYMKKTLLVLIVVILALGAFGAGAALAQGQQLPFQGPMMGRGGGWMHEFVEEALADKPGITETQIEEGLNSGKTMYQIALDEGIQEADVPALLQEVHEAAFDKAVADGVISREQADWMLQRMKGNWANQAYGTCPMHNGGYGPQNSTNVPQGGQGFRGGPGGGMMGGRWLNQ